MLSVVEWEHLTDDQKELHSTMRESWLSSYNKASHTVLQHWLRRFLKKQTESFAPLHKVFSKIKVDSADSGTSAWTEIFLLYPVTGASITIKVLACGLKTCGCPLQAGTGHGRPGGDGAWAARTGSGQMLMRGDIFAASRSGGAGC
jgi:hypothetical protein